MKRSFLLPILVCFFSSLTAMAQDLYVKSFQSMPMDMTASSLTGKRIDRNGEVAALIKIVTPEKDFFFDGGTLGIVDSKEEIGEIWVWVPRAARKITIGHPQLGIIKNYEYPISIEAERTYEMILTTEKQEATTGSLGVDGSPDGATVYLNGEEKGVTPKLITGLAEGNYEVRVVKEGYTEHNETVSVKIGQRAQVTVKLKASVPVGAINGVFSVSETKKVYFSKGNLQYQASTHTWRFAENQWDFVGGDVGSAKIHIGNVPISTNNSISEHYAGWIDLFGWGTSGFNHGAVCYQPWSVSENEADYQAYGKENSNLHDQDGTADWGYNAISNGGNAIGQWYVLDSTEWNYLINVRETASGIRQVYAIVHETNGLILVPDNWKSSLTGFQLKPLNPPSERNNYDDNIISDSDWTTLEAAGMVFLPAGGGRSGSSPTAGLGTGGSYYTASQIQYFYYEKLLIGKGTLGFGENTHPYLWPDPEHLGFSVRLVHDAEQQWGKASAYSQITFTVDADAEIWVDGEKKGVRSWKGNLTDGSHRMECRLANHESSFTTLEIDESKAGQTIVLAAPKPICGSLSVKSTPDHAQVFIDGNDLGETPINLPELIIGQHELLFVKEGYVDHTETMKIVKGERKQVNVKLNKGHAIQFTCNVCDAELEIDGKKIGLAKGNYQITNGSHKLKATAKWYRDNEFTLKVDDNSSQSHEIAMECIAKPEETFTVNGVSFKMKLVEGGTFMMGNEMEDDAKPVHEVTLSTFYLGEVLVTQGLWNALMGSEPKSNPGDFPQYVGWTEKTGKGNDLPAYDLSWEDCHKFIVKLNQMTGKNFRLPTEAEWEFAFKKQYELGFSDKIGKKWEWCEDFYRQEYDSEPQVDPICDTKAQSWSDDHVLRNSKTRYGRNSASSGYHDTNYVFRLCLPH